MNKTTTKKEPKTRAGVLVDKLQELGVISSTISLHARKLNKKEMAAVDTLEANMSSDLQALLLESRIDEADIKIHYMRQVVDIVQVRGKK